MNSNIMLLGTASSVGKSTIATGICRYFKNKGIKVAPFKAMNISLNSYVTEDGLEMGRAQVVQADACDIKPSAYMNPLLLKPCGDCKTQVIVNGLVYKVMDSYKYKNLNKELKVKVKESYNILSKDYDLIVLEGSGSCAEINLKDSDIANMSMAKMVDAPVILVADIDKGGVFASVVGTLMLLDEDERNLVKGVIINKFRGNSKYFDSARKQLEDIIKIPVLGVMPYVDLDIEDEDSITERLKNKEVNGIDIAVIRLPHMSNFTDFNPLDIEENVTLRYVSEASEMGKPHVIILPGTKTTIEDLRYIKENGIYDEIISRKSEGTIIFGICGGYQMLGEVLCDEYGVEGDIKEEVGFNLLRSRTIFKENKTTIQSVGKVTCSGGIFNRILDCKVTGYEIHNGVTVGNKNDIFIEDPTGEPLGMINKEGNVLGTYLHGIFDNDEFRRLFIQSLIDYFDIYDTIKDSVSYQNYKKSQFDKLVEVMKENLDMKKIEEIINKA